MRPIRTSILTALTALLLLIVLLWGGPLVGWAQGGVTNFTNVTVARDLRVGRDVLVTRNLQVTGVITAGGIITAGNLDLPGDLIVRDDLTVIDDASIGDDLTILGGLTGLVAFNPAITQVITENDTLNATGTMQPISSTAAAAMSGNSITIKPAGTLLILVNVGAQTITFTETGILKSAGNIALGTLDSASLLSDGTSWYQIAGSNN